MDCEHEDTLEGVCVDCGLLIEEDYGDLDNEPLVTSKKTILNKLDLPHVIRDSAEHIAAETKEMYGKNIRNDKVNTFYLIYRAYEKNGFRAFTVKFFEDKFHNIKRKDINRSVDMMSNFSLKESKTYENNGSLFIIHPIVYIHKLCVLNDIENKEKYIRELTNNIIRKKDELLALRPQILAAAIIKKIMLGMGKKKIEKNEKIPDPTLKSYMKYIEEFF